MRNLKLTIAYDGTNYHGFQIQKGQMTIQQVLQETLSKIFDHKITIAGSGRTDAKVHALGQVISFSTTGRIPTQNIVKAAKTLLPSDIAVLDAKEVQPDFHARFSACSKQYIYKILQSKLPNPFYTNYALIIDQQLDIQKMQQAADIIIGEHDFSSFKASGSTVIDPIRTMYEANWQKKDEQLIFTIKGNGFLYHMVRNLVGCFIEIGKNKLSIDEFLRILQAKDRKKACKTAPPQGLYLDKVFYG